MGYNTKRIRHVCSVKGCNNRDTILIAKNGQIGGVYLCEECAKKAAEVFGGAKKKAVKAEAKAEVKDDVVEETSEDAVKAESVKGKRRTMVIPKDGE